nr:CHASE2 domain-containing protein [Oscillatoria sp. FACHB-1406]
MNSWLEQSEFRPIASKLSETVSLSDRVRVLICSSHPQVKKLPWHLWEWLEREGRQAEAILSTTDNQPQESARRQKVRILIILGKSPDISPENDLKILTETLGDRAEILPPLVSPNRQEVNRHLWDTNTDILFFAGHSQTDEESGKFYLSETEFIRVEDLKYALQEARKNGLKLAIFNSCDGLGLARELESLYIPNLIVMRDIVHERIAHQFLSDFLKAFAIEQKPLHLAVLKARRRLQGLEAEFPCASWMPVICQNSSAEAQYWQNWALAPPRARPRPLRYPVLVASAIATFSIVLARSLGILEPLELKAYDHLMAMRPPEPLDERILVVAADETDLKRYGTPLLSDATLTQALLQLKQHQPRAIGLDIFRSDNSPTQSDLAKFITTVQKNKNFIHVCSQIIPPLSKFSEQQLQEQVGFADFYPDERDNIVRRQPLWLTPPSTSDCPNSYYAFSLLLAQRYLEAEGKLISFKTGNLQFGTTIFNKLASRTGGYQQLNGESGEILLNFRAPDRNGQIAKTVSLRDILDDRVDPKFIKNKVVLVGVTDPKLQDDRDTPYGVKRGLWIHAQMVSALLSAVENNRKPIWGLPQLPPQWGSLQWGDALWIFAWSFLSGLLAIKVRSHWVRLLSGFILLGVLYKISLVILTAGGWMPLVPSLLSIIITGLIVNYTLLQLKQK